MEIEIKEIQPCVSEMTITVDAERVMEDYRGILRTVRGMAVVPGFRKGKAPLGMVDQMYGEHAREELGSKKLEVYFAEALEDRELKPLTEGELVEWKWEKREPLTATFRFETAPVVVLAKYKDLEIPFEPAEVSDEDIEKHIDAVREKAAVLEDTNEPVQKGDHVQVEIQIQKGDDKSEPIPRTLIAGETVYGEKFEEKLLGTRPEDVFIAEVPRDKSNPESDTIDLEVKVLAVTKKIVPELDDEFARDSEYDSLEAMRTEIRSMMEKEYERKNKEEKREAITTALIDANRVDVPPSFVHQYASQMADGAAKQYGMKPQDLLPVYSRVARRQWQRYYIIEKIKEVEKIEVTDDDIQAMIEELADNVSMTVEEYRERYDKTIKSDDFKDTILERKLYDLIEATSTFVKPEEKPAEDEDGTAEEFPEPETADTEEAKPEHDKGDEVSGQATETEKEEEES